MADTSVKLSGTYDSIEAYNILEEMRDMSSEYEEIKTEAEAAASAATAAVTTAQGYANSAGTYADNAQTYAGNANTSAGEAAGYASDAQTAATNAAASETNASNSASAAATSASNAEASEAVVAGALPLSGGTMTGTLTLADGGRALSDATVGTVVSNSSNNVSVGNTAKSIVSISLSAGTWVVTGTVGYANIVATRMMIGLNTAVELYANTEGTTSIHSGATSSNPVGLTTTRIFVLNATSTVHLLGYVQGSTSVNATTNTIRAVRIK